jgi:hypothetical protein
VYFTVETANALNIVSIELGVYDNIACRWVNTEDGETLTFDRRKYEKLEELNADAKEQLLTDFSVIAFMGVDESVNEPTGYCLLFNLTNGDYIVVSSTTLNGWSYGMFARFNSNDEFQSVVASFDGVQEQFANLLDNYFQTYVKPVK